MRTMFGRMFTLTLALILLSCLLLGIVFRLEISQYLFAEKRETLLSNANSVANLASAYNTAGELEDNWDFRIGISMAADVTDSETLVYDEAGRIILCSSHEMQCTNLGAAIPEKVVERTSNTGHFYEYGDLGGLFSGKKLLVSVPMISDTTGEEIGGVIVSTELTQVNTVVSHTTNIFLITGGFILLVAAVVTYFWTGRETKQLKMLTRTVREFGRGNLEARAPTGEKNTEEMEELTVAFNNMATGLAKSEVQRREFVANVSHELKTPMTTIAGYMDGMIDGTIPAELHLQYMTRVSDEVRRLSRLVRSMLEVSRIQDQGIPEEKKRRFNICESIGRILLTFEQRINVKSLDVEVQMPDNGVGVWAEEDSITQVIYNLIDNAVKFCDEGGALYLQVESDGVKATVSVANTGQTIPEAELPLVFDRFHKTDKSRSRDREGVGLGLYIVRTIVATHGENISVTSRDGVTRFSFTLPVK